MCLKQRIWFLVPLAMLTVQMNAQITKRERPKQWEALISGGRFMDLFETIPTMASLTKDTWGADYVVPRYIDNGIEDEEWSYWGGNALLGTDGKYHLFVCRWREDSAKGHMEWFNSLVVHSVSDNPLGPYKVKEEIGPGHNPEVFQLADGRFVIYVIDGRYIAKDINGPWEYSTFEFDNRNRRINDGLSNLTFAQREDGSYLMVCRGGGIWFSKDGMATYNQVTDKSVYPAVEGAYEDPVVWRTEIQYHMIVNDWLGRIAYYLRSKDGVQWKIEPGEAYLPGIATYTDGTNIDWFKYERIKVLQDEYGRAIQANFAVIDTLKHHDLPKDGHSSKNIGIPLTVGKRITILNEDKIDGETKSIRVKIRAEKGFDPHKDMDMGSLRFGASEHVNFGKGSKVLNTEKSGQDLIVTFRGADNGMTDDNFVAKLLGKTISGKLLFGYARLPGINYIEPILSARMPTFTKNDQGYMVEIEVENFGQVASEVSSLKIKVTDKNGNIKNITGKIPPLDSFQKTKLSLKVDMDHKENKELDIEVTIFPKNQSPVLLHGTITLKK
jgi:hypothetical protein